MKITIDIAAADLACIWSDTWEDKAPDTIAQRVKHLVEAKAVVFRRQFTCVDPAALTDAFLSSRAAQGADA